MKLSSLMDDIPIMNRKVFKFRIFVWDCKRMDCYNMSSIPDKVLEYMCNDIEFDLANNICTIWLDKEVE